MTRLRVVLRQLPIPVTGMLVGCIVCGVVGGVIGLIIGLRTYVPTAWFAVLEIGIPAGMVGCLLGLFFGLIAQWIAHAPRDAPERQDNARG